MDDGAQWWHEWMMARQRQGKGNKKAVGIDWKLAIGSNASGKWGCNGGQESG
jgi:hypothetical protein